MKRMLFNARQAEELRVAIVDGQTLLDLDIETLGKEQRKGNIYKGVITRIEPSLEACFVDYGTDRHGFLPFKEVSRSYFQDYEGGKVRIQDVLKEGMQVIVQVEKDERGNKGAALTTFISLAGRYLVLMPNNPRGGGVSRRIEGDERQELKEAMAQLDVPHGMSIIARTAGIGRSVEELQWDFNYLLQLWRAIEEAAAAHKDPYLLFMESSLVIRAIRDYFRPDIGEILVDNREVYEQVSEFMSYVMPNNLGRLKLYEDHTPLFSRLQIEQQIETAFSRSVSLPSGGAIVIDHTEALVSVDVNSARSTRGADIEETAFKTNMEAAEEVARQMRLRDLGGLVVIDFIDMEDARNQREVENTLRDALKKDRARVQMGKLSRFGLLELSRQRLQPALAESSHIACPRCAGTGVIRSIESTALHVLRLIQDAAMKDNTGEVHAQVPVDVATFLLNEKRAELFGMEERLDVSVFLIPNTNLENPHYEITRIRNDDVDENAEPSYKRVSQPEIAEPAPFTANSSKKTVRQEPAVKGVKHTSPAPIVEKSKDSWWVNIKGWLRKLFGSNETVKVEDTTKRKSSKRNNPNRRQAAANNNRRNNKVEKPETVRRKRNEETVDKVDSKVTVAEKLPENNLKAETTDNNTRRRNNKAEKVENTRRNRNNQEERTQQAANNDEVALNVMTETSAEQTAPSQTSKRNRKKQKPLVVRIGDKRNNRKSQERRRGIPSAAKIEHYLPFDVVTQNIENAIAHVLSQYPDLSEQSSLVANWRARQTENIEQIANNQAAESAEQEQQIIQNAVENVQTAVVAVIGIDHDEPDASVQEVIKSNDNTHQATSEQLVKVADVITLEADELALPLIAEEDLIKYATSSVESESSNLSAQTNVVEDELLALINHLDLGDLQFVETDLAALAMPAATAVDTLPKKLCRKDLPKIVTTPVVHTEMVQIETIKSL